MLWIILSLLFALSILYTRASWWRRPWNCSSTAWIYNTLPFPPLQRTLSLPFTSCHRKPLLRPYLWGNFPRCLDQPTRHLKDICFTKRTLWFIANQTGVTWREFHCRLNSESSAYSPVKQQQHLNGYRLRHINQLVAGRRGVCPDLVWTVAYFRESVCAHGRREVMAPDYQQEHKILSMVIVLLARPQQVGKYAQGCIGHLVDIARVSNNSGHNIGHSSTSSVVGEFGGTQDTHCVSMWLGDIKSEQPLELKLKKKEMF